MAKYIELEALMKYPIRIDHYDKEHGKLDFVLGIESVLEYAEALPAVDVVEVKHGRWINWGKSGTPTYENYGTCSVCHEDAEIYTEHRNYCSNCGARMDGDGDATN